jgi:hypothetical protein
MNKCQWLIENEQQIYEEHQVLMIMIKQKKKKNKDDLEFNDDRIQWLFYNSPFFLYIYNLNDDKTKTKGQNKCTIDKDDDRY